MTIVNPGEISLADIPKKKLGPRTGYGVGHYGVRQYGEDDPNQGIYQTRKGKKSQIIVKEKFYVPTNPNTEAQQIVREKMAEGVRGWQNLTEEDKEWYNNKARGKRFSGFNLFIKKALLD